MADEKRIVLVTGAAGGIGKALVELFAEIGETVVATDLPGSGVADVAAQFGSVHLGLEGDLASADDVARLYAEIDRRFGRLDVLVNNAAMGPTMSPTVDTSLDAFRRTLSVNLLAPFLMAREAARRMRPGGAIVNIASLAGILGNPRRNAYSASKAGLISFTRSLACEWAASGIRVTAVAPGYVRTPMVAELEAAGKVDLAAVRRRVPLGRMARPDEMARAARFLASPQARYITGAILAVDGGWASFNQPGEAHPPAEAVPEAEMTRPQARFNGRIVLVTGGANGIGAATARRFAANGDHVVVADRDGRQAEAVVSELGSGHLALESDVANETDVLAMFEAIIQRFGKLDILVNNAAIADTFLPALEQSPQDMMALLDVNLTGAFVVAREAVRAMKNGGVILNVGSINTFLPFAPRHAYGASKAGIDILTRCMAAELGPSGIRAATIAPGYIRTPGVAQLEQSGRIDADRLRRRIPLGDLGRPDDIAEAALFLASSEASYITGSILYVDGGWTAFGNAGDASAGIELV
jgi:NAD(P)-dependent dehydrogenase (short-subunit alcohol dehydrogenase family)